MVPPAWDGEFDLVHDRVMFASEDFQLLLDGEEHHLGEMPPGHEFAQWKCLLEMSMLHQYQILKLFVVVVPCRSPVGRLWQDQIRSWPQVESWDGRGVRRSGTTWLSND